jgi:hypothetical protein
MFYQEGGKKYTNKYHESQLISEPRTLRNGAKAGYFPNPKGGKAVWRIFEGSPARRPPVRPALRRRPAATPRDL